MAPNTDPKNENDSLNRGGSRGALSDMRVLVLDDSEDSSEMLCRLLQMDGADVEAAQNGMEALEFVRTREFDVILSDISMPEMNGFEFLKRLRALPVRKEVPVVAVTGSGTPEDKVLVEREGFSFHLVKPIDIEELVRFLVSLVQRRAAASGQ